VGLKKTKREKDKSRTVMSNKWRGIQRGGGKIKRPVKQKYGNVKFKRGYLPQQGKGGRAEVQSLRASKMSG